jgi:hypothetical protein
MPKLRTFIPNRLLGLLKEAETKMQLRKWEQAGRPIPPVHAVKRTAIREAQAKNGAKTLVETGTYTGEMVFVQLRKFDEISSIELSDHYYEQAVKRFRRYKKVHLYHGDSAVMLPEVVARLNGPAVFWLDGHYSGGLTAKGATECPLFGELEAILPDARPHILLIDDAHCFVGRNDYPTIDALKRYLSERGVEHTFFVKDNIIHIELG